MASKRNGAARATKRVPLTKVQLLPMDVASAREQSLSYHLALDSWRRGHGNGRLVNELMRVTYIAWFLQQAGYGSEPVELFKLAEYAAEITLAQAHNAGQTDAWTLDEDALPAFKSLLALHDAQLATVPLHRFDDAKRQLMAFLHDSARSPIPVPDLAS
ncbi:hypothetical protein R70006_04929 [Paraburkholderia domus]|nr:hypothetical protein R70006_04929 [Paraburkholderia domus]